MAKGAPAVPMTGASSCPAAMRMLSSTEARAVCGEDVVDEEVSVVDAEISNEEAPGEDLRASSESTVCNFSTWATVVTGSETAVEPSSCS